jgi:alkylation response protein AidB-like acyl-CoA dehydrogenase
MSVYQENAQKNIQIHGGIGYTWEHNAHLYLRRAAALRVITETAGNPNDDIYELSEKNVGRIYAVDLPPEADRYRVEARELVARYHETAEANRRSLLVESGYLVPHWPRPFGRGAGPVEQLVIEQELASIDVPNLRVGGWVLLTLTQTATEEQIERWILPSLRGELVWCQLFSEPDAGSDAAAIQTRARRVKGGWQVTGQKAWTSAAQNCNRGLATVRTDPDAPKHKGITAVAVDLTASGVEVRPLRDMTGESRFNEVFFDEVFVPDSDVVGEVNGGWSVARATLGNERVTLGSGSRIGVSAAELPALATRSHAAGEDARRSIARLLAEEHAMRVINLRQVARAVSGALPGSEGNVTKLLSAEHMQRVSELALTLMGLDSVTGDHEDLPYQYLFDRCLSIAGGTSEITRNVIAERILGLPRDPLIR